VHFVKSIVAICAAVYTTSLAVAHIGLCLKCIKILTGKGVVLENEQNRSGTEVKGATRNKGKRLECGTQPWATLDAYTGAK